MTRMSLHQLRRVNTVLFLIIALALASGCRSRRLNQEEIPETDKDARIAHLTESLSRAQSRIEELDAKISALSDKVDSTRLIVDNVAGTKPLETKTIGMPETAPTEEPVHDMHLNTEHKMKTSDDTVINAFNKAMSMFKSGKYTDAVLAFNQFDETYPDHTLAGSAQFYAGESYLQMGEFKLAINEYEKVLSSYRSSPRMASALVRLSQCHKLSGQPGESEKYFAMAKTTYEGNPSLDWPTPGHSGSSGPKPLPDLNVSPIEPNH